MLSLQDSPQFSEHPRSSGPPIVPPLSSPHVHRWTGVTESRTFRTANPAPAHGQSNNLHHLNMNVPPSIKEQDRRNVHRFQQCRMSEQSVHAWYIHDLVHAPDLRNSRDWSSPLDCMHLPRRYHWRTRHVLNDLHTGRLHSPLESIDPSCLSLRLGWFLSLPPNAASPSASLPAPACAPLAFVIVRTCFSSARGFAAK